VTPLQLELHQARKARLQRFAEAAQRPVSLPPPIPPEPEPAPVAAPIEPEQPTKRPYWFWMIAEPQRRYPPVKVIQHAVADHYGVTVHEILSPRRTAKVVMPRQIAMYLAKKLTLKSLPEVGRRFGGRDHTTVMHAVRKIESLAQEDESLSAELSALSAAILPNTPNGLPRS
jgi:hypothetical protein